MTLKELREKQAKLVADARAKLEEIKDDTPETRAKEIETEYDAMMAEYDRLEERARREEALAERESAINDPDPRRPVGENRAIVPAPPGEITRDIAFREWLRSGLDGVTAAVRQVLREMRAQGVATGAAGEFTVPLGFMAELVKGLKMWGPMLDPGVTRELVTSTGNQIEWPTMDDTANMGALLAENTVDTEQDIVFGQKLLDAYKYTSKIIRVSEELMQDSAFDIEGIVRDAMAERVARIVNLHLTTGTGAGQPNGVVTASTLGFTAAANNAITFDEIIELAHSVDPAYRTDPSTRFMFRDSTLKVLRKIKDGNLNYIWQPADVRTAQPASILGYPYEINQDVPAIATIARSVVFGAFRYYVVRRVREWAMKRLVERYADFYQVGFLGFGRFDGELTNTAAVKHLVHPV